MRGDSNFFTLYFPGRLDKTGSGIALLTHIPNFCVPSITFKLTSIPCICGSIPSLSSISGIWNRWSTGSCIRLTRISFFVESRITILESTWSICIGSCIPSFFTISIGNIPSICWSTNLCGIHTHSGIVAHLVWKWA